MSRINIKKAGLKVTVPRINILKILENSSGHFSADDIYSQLKSQGAEVSLATVYRVLAQFETAGLIIRHNFGDGSATYELDDGKQHDHLVCTECGKVDEFVDEIILEQQASIALKKGFKIISHSLNIFGLCTNCQQE